MKPAGYTLEKHFWSMGKKYIVGLDEVGRGAWAGPLVVGAVIFPINTYFPTDLYDSKLLQADQREELSPLIKEHALAYKLIQLEVAEIDRVGIGQASHLAFQIALQEIEIKPDFVLVDGFSIRDFSPQKQMAILKGDQLSASIAAASIIAKVHRDELMNTLAADYPGYGLAANKGYGTKAHRQALRRLGPSDIHRTSFKNIAALIKGNGSEKN